MQIEELIQQQGRLDIVHPDMSTLFEQDQVVFSLIRRSGLGASDASVYLGVNLYQKLEDLIAEKQSIGYTDKEQAISELENVRKGRDLEPIILRKFEEKFKTEVQKPKPMYRIKEHPQLTINYDGLIVLADQLIPVEAKYVSPFGTKYYDQSKCIEELYQGQLYNTGGATLVDHITDNAKMYGIPAYYYTQVQQQMLGVLAPFAYLTVLFDKGWKSGTYKIFADNMTQEAIIRDSAIVWTKVKPLS